MTDAFPYWLAIFITGTIWFILFFFNKVLRREMLATSFLITPFVFIDYFTTPNYWSPKTIGNIPVGLEAFIFTFFLAGIAGVIYEIIFHKQIVKRKFQLKLSNLLIFMPALVLAFVIFSSFNINVIFFIIFSLLFMAATIILLKKNLFNNAVLSALTFGLLYFLVFNFWQVLVPQSLGWWNLNNLSGILLGRIPLEELAFAISFGAFTGPLYEFLI